MSKLLYILIHCTHKSFLRSTEFSTCFVIHFRHELETKVISFLHMYYMFTLDAIYTISRKRMLTEFRKLEQLECENKFILHAHPMELFGGNKLPPRFNNTTMTPPRHKEGTLIIQGRILPQREPYCRASFLIQIMLPEEFPFRCPQVMFLDPIYHPLVEESGNCCGCSCGFGFGDSYKPTTSVTDIVVTIMKIIDSDISSPDSHNPQRMAEYHEDYQTFCKKALESTLSYGRPRDQFN
jgi:ubiquitin-protein ligase